MADPIIGALRAILGIDTAAFSTGLKNAEKDLKTFGVNFGSLAKKLSIAAAVTAFAVDIKKMINAADEIGKASQKFGVPVEQLSALKYAADLADVSFESLGKGLGKLSKAMLEGVTNPAGEAAKTFAALGISVRDSSGNIKSTETVFTDIAAKFATMEDGAAKTALAIRLFGRAGADLIPLLNQGRNGIKAMTDEAAKLGIVISADTAAKAEEFNDTLKRIGAALDGIVLQVTAELLPALQGIANLFFKAAQQGSGFQSFIRDLITEEDLREVQRYTQYWENLINILRVFRSITPQSTIGAIDRALQDAVAGNKQALKDLEGGFKFNLGNIPAAIDGMDRLKFGTKGAFDGVNTGALSAKNAFDQFIISQQKSIAATQAEAQTVGLSTGMHAYMKTTLEGLAIAQANNISLSQKQRDALVQTALAAQLAADELSANKLIAESIPEWQKLQDKIVEIQRLMDLFPEKAEKLKPALLKTQTEINTMLASAAAAMLGAISQVFMAFGQHNKRLFEIGKAFAIAEAIVNTFKAANMALAAPPGPPFSYAYMAAAIATGLANVVKIQQQKYTGAALGGSFKVPGGMSSFDSKLVPMMLSPGERVDVTPSNRAGSESRELIIPSIKPKDFFTGETVREMVLSIDQWMRDGGTGIKLAT